MRIKRFPLIFLLSAAAAAGSAGAQTSAVPAPIAPTSYEARASKDDRYKIGFQDVVDIQVFKHPELSLRATVNPNGMIYLYRLEKPLSAVCKTERELADDIAAAYKVSYLRDPQVNVVVAEQKSQSMSVIGAVEKPGFFYVGRRVHLLELLAMAGGPNKESGTRILVARSGSNSNCKTPDSDPVASDDLALMSFKLRDVQEGKKTLWMQPGDVVSVLDADVVYVYGNVVKPGLVKVREPITLRQAIASSEGIKPATNQDKVRILRQKPDSIERTEFAYSLKEIEKGTIADPYLEPNDIVAVSLDPVKNVLVNLSTAIRNGIPTILARGIPIP